MEHDDDDNDDVVVLVVKMEEDLEDNGGMLKATSCCRGDVVASTPIMFDCGNDATMDGGSTATTDEIIIII